MRRAAFLDETPRPPNRAVFLRKKMPKYPHRKEDAYRRDENHLDGAPRKVFLMRVWRPQK